MKASTALKFIVGQR